MDMEWVRDGNLNQTDFFEGAALMIDKPKQLTSFDVVHKLRAELNKRGGADKIKVGHSGTLDPLATGLLILCTGGWTPKLHQLQRKNKIYRAELCIGAVTPTYDEESEVVEKVSVDHITRKQLLDAFEQFSGTIVQTPPLYSAAKVKGKPLYKYAREGKEVTPRPRKVTIERLTLDGWSGREVRITVECSRGTYIRSLVRDIGEVLNIGAYLTKLRRTAIGPYRAEHAWKLEDLINRLRNI